MDKLLVPRLPAEACTPLFRLAPQLDQLDAVPIAADSWPAHPHTVKAGFRMAHDGNHIFLKFNVTEPYLLANAVTNQAIHEDSCVEFFVAFEDDDNYYNLEFNCLGWAKVAYGPDRENRSALPPEVVENIPSATRVEARAGGQGKLFEWEITLMIPRALFIHHDFGSFNNLKARGNLYKSGTRMPEPHFLTWKPITTADPDFHRKEFFGLIAFE